MLVVAIVMLCVHIVTVVCVSRLPETKGMSMGLVEHESDIGDEDDNDLSMIETSIDNQGELS